jgi:transposase
MVAGERDPKKLAEFSDPRIHASREEVAKSLEGNWHPELLFVLQLEVQMYDTYQQRIAECDQRLQKHLASAQVPERFDRMHRSREMVGHIGLQ